MKMMNLLEEEIEKQENISVTENGAIGYKSSDSALVNINYMVSSLRNATEEKIISLFDDAFYENKEYALRWLFFARDVRGGLGERRLFRVCYERLVDLDVDLFIKNLHNISEYGRWDDVISLIGISEVTNNYIKELLKSQLTQDLYDLKNNQPISLLGKWLPSENASSKETKEKGKVVRRLLGLSSKKYRLLLSKLRKYLDVVEVKMCNNEWDEIDYDKVPSLANLKYKDAFMFHDEIRREEYLESVKKGKAKLNMKVASPVDVVSKYSVSNFWIKLRDYDETLELAWDNLSDVMVADTLVVADGSGSMWNNVSGSVKAIDVANALAIYTSEHNTGVYKDKYITFSNKPQFVDLSKLNNLHDKIDMSLKYNEMANTNIEAVFNLILKVAIKNNISQDEMIKNILIISDMEFDKAQTCHWYNDDVRQQLDDVLFEKIKMRYTKAGYVLPKLIFWNVASRTGTIPIVENDLGVALVSGFSQNVLKMVMSNKYNPYDILLDMILVERYDKIVV